MRYRLKEGVVILRICESDFLFPTAKAGFRLHMLYPITPETAGYLSSESHSDSLSELSEAALSCLRQLVKFGLIEDC